MMGTITSTPEDMFTSPKEGERRYKVEDKSESESRFESGKSYRIDYKVDMAQNAQPIVLKFEIDAPIDLTLSELNLAEGGVHYEVFAGAQATETVPFTTVEQRIFPRNAREPSNPLVTFYSGGDATFTGEANTNLYVRTASGGGNRQNAVSSESSKRGFPATTVYIRMTIINGVNTDVIGTLKLEYEVI